VPFDPLVIQAAIAIPIALGLTIYTLLRWEGGVLHGLLAALLIAVSVWLGGSALKVASTSEGLRLVGLHLEWTSALLLPTLFLITMGYFARSSLFEQNLAPSIALLSVSGVFLLGYATDPLHHLYYVDRTAAIASRPPTEWAGPVFWASQVWAASADLASFVLCGSVLVRGPTHEDRGRAAMVFTAVLVPIAAHIAYLLELLPIDFSLAPGSLALTAVFFVQGVDRYGLLGGQTIVRHDLIEHLEDGLVLADDFGRVLDANAAAEAAVGASRVELRGRSLPEVLDLLGAGEPGRELAERVLSLPLDGSRVTAELHTADDRQLDVKAGAVPALGAQPSGRFLSIQDRTAARRSERLLRERQKLESVGILAAGVAHEVNNPLAYVLANLHHLRETADALAKSDAARDLEELQEIPDVLVESIDGLDRIANVVQRMLRFSRVPDERHRAVDVHHVIDESIRLAALGRGSSVHTQRCDEELRVLGSAEQLVQVLLNLLLNAKHATREQPDARIDVVVRREGELVAIDVRDDGPGIPEAVRDRIFDPFFTTRGPGEGTGLGLSIAFDIVREHGGTLGLAPVDEGCCFRVRLPLVAAEAGEDDAA